MKMDNQNRIFLCHASEDRRKVTEVYWQLKDAEFNPWLDRMDLLPGQEWDREIRKALKSSKLIIIFFSNASISKRGYLQREFKLALEILEEIPSDEIFIVPIRLDECILPDDFSHIQYVDLFNEEGLDKIFQSINSVFKSSNKKLDKKKISQKGAHSDTKKDNKEEPIDPILYLKKLFGMWTISGYTLEDSKTYKYSLSAFNSLLRLHGYKSPDIIMSKWIKYSKTIASEATGLPTTMFDSFNFKTADSYESLTLEESYFRLWKIACERKESTNMMKVRVALSATVGHERQSELIDAWNKRLR